MLRYATLKLNALVSIHTTKAHCALVLYIILLYYSSQDLWWHGSYTEYKTETKRVLVEKTKKLYRSETQRVPVTKTRTKFEDRGHWEQRPYGPGTGTHAVFVPNTVVCKKNSFCSVFYLVVDDFWNLHGIWNTNSECSLLREIYWDRNTKYPHFCCVCIISTLIVSMRTNTYPQTETLHMYGREV